MSNKKVLCKLVTVLFLTCVFVVISSLVSWQSAYASSALSSLDDVNYPDCNTNHITDLSGGYFSFRTVITCSSQVDRISSTAFAQYETPQDDNFTTILGSTVQSSCMSCQQLLNPGSGGIVTIGVSGYPSGTTYQVKEIIGWQYTDRGGAHTQTKTVAP